MRRFVALKGCDRHVTVIGTRWTTTPPQAPPSFGIAKGRGRGGRGAAAPPPTVGRGAGLASIDLLLRSASAAATKVRPEAPSKTLGATQHNSHVANPAKIRPTHAASSFLLPGSRAAGHVGRIRSSLRFVRAGSNEPLPDAITDSADAEGSRLPLVDAILNAWATSPQVIGVAGATGSGKSSLFPLALVELLSRPLPGDTKAQASVVWVAQPTRLACVNLAHHVANLLGSPVGGVVGYAVGDGDANLSATTRIVFTTAGYLARLLGHATVAPHGGGGDSDSGSHRIDNSNNSRLPTRYDGIVIDEVHVGDEELQLLFAVIKARFFLAVSSPQQSAEPRPRIAVMSATWPGDAFAHACEFFSSTPPRVGSAREAVQWPLLDVGTSRFRVETHYAGALPAAITTNMPPQVVRAAADAATAVKGSPARTPASLPKVIAELAMHCVTRPPAAAAEVKQASTDEFGGGDLRARAADSQLPQGVMVFLPGLEEIHAVARQLSKLAASASWTSSVAEEGAGAQAGSDSAGLAAQLEGTHDDILNIVSAEAAEVEVLILHGSAFASAQRSAMLRKLGRINQQYRAVVASQLTGAGSLTAPKRHRKRVYLATNVAESSVTLPDVRTVIDSGYIRYDTLRTVPSSGATPTATASQHDGVVDVLATRLASASSVMQRIGRVGRTFAGHAIVFHPEWASGAGADERGGIVTEPDLHATAWRFVDAQRILLRLAAMPVVRAANPRIADCFVGPLLHNTISSEQFDQWVIGLAHGLVSQNLVTCSPEANIQVITSLVPTFTGEVASQLSVPLHWSRFFAIATAAGVGIDAVAAYAVMVHADSARVGSVHAEGFVNLLHRREVAFRKQAGKDVSDVWTARNVGVEFLKAEPAVSRGARSVPRTTVGVEYGIGPSPVRSLTATLGTLLRQLVRCLRRFNAECAADSAAWRADVAGMEQLLAVERPRSKAVDGGDIPQQELLRESVVKSLFPTANEDLVHAKLKVAFTAAFAANAVAGVPQLFLPSTLLPHIVPHRHQKERVDAVYVAPLRPSGGPVPPETMKSLVAAFRRVAEAGLPALLSNSLAAAVAAVRVVEPHYLVVELSPRYMAQNREDGYAATTVPSADVRRDSKPLAHSSAINQERAKDLRQLPPLVTALSLAMSRGALTTCVAVPPRLPSKALDTVAADTDDEMLLRDVSHALDPQKAAANDTTIQMVTEPAPPDDVDVVGGTIQQVSKAQDADNTLPTLDWEDDLARSSSDIPTVQASDPLDDITPTPGASVVEDALMTVADPEEDSNAVAPPVASAPADRGVVVMCRVGVFKPLGVYAWHRTAAAESVVSDVKARCPVCLCVLGDGIALDAHMQSNGAHRAAVMTFIRAGITKKDVVADTATVLHETPSSSARAAAPPSSTVAQWNLGSIVAAARPAVPLAQVQTSARLSSSLALAVAAEFVRQDKTIFARRGWLLVGNNDDDYAAAARLAALGAVLASALTPTHCPVAILSTRSLDEVAAVQLVSSGVVLPTGDVSAAELDHWRSMASALTGGNERGSIRKSPVGFRRALVRSVTGRTSAAVRNVGDRDDELRWLPVAVLQQEAAEAVPWSPAGGLSATLAEAQIATLVELHRLAHVVRCETLSWLSLHDRLGAAITGRLRSAANAAQLDPVLKARVSSGDKGVQILAGCWLLQELATAKGFSTPTEMLRGMGVVAVRNQRGFTLCCLPLRVPTSHIPTQAEVRSFHVAASTMPAIESTSE
jgi:hypothetical protein